MQTRFPDFIFRLLLRCEMPFFEEISIKSVRGLVLIVGLSVIPFATPGVAGGMGGMRDMYKLFSFGRGFVPSALAEDIRGGIITILSPKNGAVIHSRTMLEFNVHPDPGGHHPHIYIDGGKPIIDRDANHCPCRIDLPKLSPGKHTIIIRESTAGHTLTGAQATVHVTVR